jgi:hypothetical protein
MSPEQASGTQLDARSDLFSVGTMLYLMITGRRPFEAPTDLEAILRVRQADFPPPGKIKPDIPSQLANVIMRAMKLAPGERYQSAEEMLIAIESIQRTVFEPAGQTELKRWLSALQEKDKVPSIGRAAPLPPSDESDVIDLVEGADLVFDDESAADQTIASGPPVDFSAVLPPPLPPGALAPPSRAGVTPPPVLNAPGGPEPGGPPPGARHRISALLLLGGAAVGGFFYLRSKHVDEPAPPAEPPPRPAARPPEKPTKVAEKPRPAPVTPPPAPEPTPPPTPAAASAPADAEPALATRPAAPDAAPLAVTPPPITPPVPPAPDPDTAEDEEALLKHKEPDAEKKVIGAETPPPPPRPGTKPKDKDWQDEYPSVSVHIVTRPEGAVIKLKDRVFGRAPMNLRFRPGIPIELSFVKSGYVTTTRKFTFARRKNQSVLVSLPRKGQKRRGLLDRILGR